MPRRQTLYACNQCLWLLYRAVDHVSMQCGEVESSRCQVGLQKGSHLGRKSEFSFDLPIVERFYAQRITSAKQRLVARIPDSERKHPVQSTNTTSAFVSIQFQYDFRIALAL